MTWAFVLLLAATATFTVLVVHRTPTGPVVPVRPDLRRPLVVGAAVLGVLALVVATTVVLTGRPDQAAKIAVLGLTSYLLYLGVLAVITRATGRR